MNQLSTAFVGTGHLVRLALRRDRIRLPMWLVSLAVVLGVSARAVSDFYDTPVKLAGYAATIESSGVARLFGGRPYDVDTLGGVLAYELTAVAGIVTALMAIFVVVRHTRSEEESGHAELVRSAVTGRQAATAAALTVSVGACVVAGLAVAGGLVVAGVGARPALIFGAGLAGAGLVFTGVAAVAAQVASTARAAIGLSIGVLLTFFVLRGVGAMWEHWLGWLSPLAWQDEVRAFSDAPRPWPLLGSVASAVALLGLAAWLATRRDFGAGLARPRTGRPRAPQWLSGPVGLAFHQQRGLWIAWSVGLFLLAVVFGAVGEEVRTMAQSNPQVADLVLSSTDDVVVGFLSFVTSFLAVVVAAYAVVSALRLRRSEETGQVANVVATAVSRTRWQLGAMAVTAGCATAGMFLTGLGISAAHAVVSGDTSQFWPVLGAAATALPAVLLLAALTFAVHGWWPRWTLVAWVPVAWAFIQAYLGVLLAFPRPLQLLSPFEHLPVVPAEPFSATEPLVMFALAVALAALAVVGLRRRDLG